MILWLYMKYILLIISILLIAYPILGILKCLESISSLSSYGVGVLVAGLLVFVTGLLLLYFTVKSLKKNKK